MPKTTWEFVLMMCAVILTCQAIGMAAWMLSNN